MAAIVAIPARIISSSASKPVGRSSSSRLATTRRSTGKRSGGCWLRSASNSLHALSCPKSPVRLPSTNPFTKSTTRSAARTIICDASPAAANASYNASFKSNAAEAADSASVTRYSCWKHERRRKYLPDEHCCSRPAHGRYGDHRRVGRAPPPWPIRNESKLNHRHRVASAIPHDICDLGRGTIALTHALTHSTILPFARSFCQLRGAR